MKSELVKPLRNLGIVAPFDKYRKGQFLDLSIEVCNSVSVLMSYALNCASLGRDKRVSIKRLCVPWGYFLVVFVSALTVKAMDLLDPRP